MNLVIKRSFTKLFNQIQNKCFCFWLGAFSLGRVVLPSPRIVIFFPGPIRSYTVKENHIGSVVNEILRYRQTENLLFYHMNIYIMFVSIFIYYFRIAKSEQRFFFIFLISFLNKRNYTQFV